jgi:hypothetical protein
MFSLQGSIIKGKDVMDKAAGIVFALALQEIQHRH